MQKLVERTWNEKHPSHDPEHSERKMIVVI